MGYSKSICGRPTQSLCWGGSHGGHLPRGVPSIGLSVQSLAGWTLENEALIRDVGTWLLLWTCICWGVSVPEEGGGEEWALVSV